MKFWWLLFLVVLHIWLNTGHCVAIGQDFCHCQLSLIETPKISIPRMANGITCTPRYQNMFTPIKDACSCVNVRVAPASIVRDDELGLTAPRCADRGSGGGCSGDTEPRQFGEPGSAFSPAASACNAGGVAQSGSPVVQEAPGADGIDEPAADSAGSGCCGGGPPPVRVAVDPVSLMLAQAEANRCRGDVREDRLAFGQVAVPRDAMPPRPATVSDVDEESLYALDKAIVELKTCKRFGKTAVPAPDTDALLALEEDAQLDDTNNATGPEMILPSYADIGYRTETPSCAPLIGGVSVPPAANPGTK